MIVALFLFFFSKLHAERGASDIARRGPAACRFCLGNAHGASCSHEITRRLTDCLRQAFELEEGDVVLNKPFSGGYITRAYGSYPIPWIQVEMNRALYLARPWFENETLSMDPERLTEINRRFESALQQFFDSPQESG